MCGHCNEHDRSAYNELIAKVAKVDKEAAEWLRTEAVNVQGFHFDGELDYCFVWSLSPQGHDFWRDIEDKIDL